MNRTETEAAISGHLPRRARRHLPAIMAAVDAHAAAEREDLDRVHAEGARRQKLVADEFQAVKAENAELGKQVRVLVEERAAALAEGNRLRQQVTALENELNTALAQARRLLTESDKLRDAYQLAWTERNQARDELTTANADRKGLAAERDEARAALAEGNRLRQELGNATERLSLARQALIADGYFTPDQIGDDIAPRIAELREHTSRYVADLQERLTESAQNCERLSRERAEAAAERDDYVSRLKALIQMLNRIEESEVKRAAAGAVWLVPQAWLNGALAAATRGAALNAPTPGGTQ